MSPSNMELRIGTIQDYNNEIIIATDKQKLGLNNGLNAKPIPPKIIPTVQGTKTKKKSLPEPDKHQTVKKQTVEKQSTQEHEDNKTALIIGSIVTSLTALFIYKIY